MSTPAWPRISGQARTRWAGEYGDASLQALRDDHDYLTAGGVFNSELIDSWIEEKTKEVIAVRNRPHPFEMNLYYSL